MVLQPLCLALGAALLVPALAAQEPQGRGEWENNVVRGPGPVEADLFHPERKTPVEPRSGGMVRVHLSSLPKSMNYMVENSAVTRRMQREVHEYLLEHHWETWEPEPILAKALPVTEDTLILAGGRGADNSNIFYGRVSEEGSDYVVTPLSKQNPLTEPRRVPKDQVESVQRGTVFTFDLKPDIQWHDGHVFDAEDVVFSLECYLNPAVDCDSVRFKFEKFAHVEALDPLTVRFFYKEQYYLALDSFYDLTIIPSHIYDLKDQENPQYDPNATAEEQGRFVTDHAANRMWIGLGPYRVTDWNEQWIDAEKFAAYQVTDNRGYVDKIRWRHISSDDAAKTALINGELDYWNRLRSEDYFGQYVKTPAFTENFYKGYVAQPYVGYITWNIRRPKFADPLVRRALNLCYDWDSAINEIYNGLGSRVTSSTVYYFSKDYDHSIEPRPFDLEQAEELLLEAGWYDRDGDDVIDKDGQPFTIEYLMPTGNKASEIIAQGYQEQLAKIGVKMTIAQREWATFLERLYERDYDCGNLAWILDLENDPEQIWHGKWADQPRSSNHAGLNDPEVNRLIEALQVELDDAARRELFFALQARIYELDPYMFGLVQPLKIAVSKRIRGLKHYGPDPTYRIREWFLVDSAAADGGRQ